MIYIFYLAKVYWSQFGVKDGLVELTVLFQRYSFFYKFNPVLTMILGLHGLGDSWKLHPS